MRAGLRLCFALAALSSTIVLTPACGGKTETEPTDAGADGGLCKPGDTKKMGCNSCSCDASGLWECTTMACIDAAQDTLGCVPGETKKLDCNSCTCMSNGEWACTGLGCIDSGTDSALDPRCPSSWAAAQTGSHDDLCPAMISCNYAEGSCACPAYCGGVPPGPDWKPTWTCTPKPPPRTDGCPDAELTDDAVCGAAGKVCSYGSCCMNQYECISGHWRKSGPICPP